MLAFFLEQFPEQNHLEKHPEFSFDRWLNEGGMPPVDPDLSAAQTLTGPIDALASEWVAGLPLDKRPAIVASWRARQTMYFLDRVSSAGPFFSAAISTVLLIPQPSCCLIFLLLHSACGRRCVPEHCRAGCGVWLFRCRWYLPPLSFPLTYLARMTHR